MKLLLISLLFTLFLGVVTSEKSDEWTGTDSCVHLTEENFDSVAMDPDRNVMVYFYAPWCGHCKKFLPQYSISCSVFASEPSVTLALLDGSTHPTLRDTYNITGYPRLMLFPELPVSLPVKEPITYTGPRKHSSLVTFLNSHAGTYRHSNGTLGSDASLVPSLSALVTSAKTIDSAFLVQLDNEIEHLQSLSGSPRAQAAAHALYRSYALKTSEKGEQYPQVEVQRLRRLIDNPLTSTAKAEEFTKKLNVVSQFLGADHLQYTGDDGLVMTLDKLIGAAEDIDQQFVETLAAAAADINMDTSLYVMYAQKIAGSGSSRSEREAYRAKELKRLAGLLASGKVLKHKKASLQLRFNVLKRFHQLMGEKGDVISSNREEGSEL